MKLSLKPKGPSPVARIARENLDAEIKFINSIRMASRVSMKVRVCDPVPYHLNPPKTASYPWIPREFIVTWRSGRGEKVTIELTEFAAARFNLKKWVEFAESMEGDEPVLMTMRTQIEEFQSPPSTKITFEAQAASS